MDAAAASQNIQVMKKLIEGANQCPVHSQPKFEDRQYRMTQHTGHDSDCRLPDEDEEEQGEEDGPAGHENNIFNAIANATGGEIMM